MNVASSVKRRSRIVTTFRFRFALGLARLKSRPSVLVWSLIPVVDEPKACFSSNEKKIPNRVGASTQPCFFPLLILNESKTLPSYLVVALVFV